MSRGRTTQALKHNHRTKSGTKDKIGPLKDNVGNLLTSNEDMSELLNRFFASVFTQELGVVDGRMDGNDDEQFSGSTRDEISYLSLRPW